MCAQIQLARWSVILLFAYGDESSDETKQRVCAVAAVTGAEDDWKRLEQKWVAKNNGIPFHAKDCDVHPGRKAYKHRTHEQNRSLYRDLSIMLAESNLYGFGVGIDLAAQRSVFPDAPHFPHFRALLQVIEGIKMHAKERAEIAEITFDSNPDTDYNSALLYADFREDSPGWKEHLASRMIFETEKTPRLQVADLLAREAMKGVDNIVGPVKRPERLSWLALHKTGRFDITYFGDVYFQFLKKRIPAMNEALGFTQPDYLAWLAKHRRQHNTTNLFRFLDEKTRGKDFTAIMNLPPKE
jgi:hypothetical protein